jgi:hypothetical protein
MNQPSLTRTRSYESNTLRLSSVTAGTASPWTNRQQLTYSYDNNSNVTSLTDGQNISQTQSFGYDWLDRLVTASTNAAGVGQYNHTYTYNAIGNLTNYAGSPYTYGSSKPHAVTAAFNNSYGYDGNDYTRPGQQLLAVRRLQGSMAICPRDTNCMETSMGGVERV